MVDDTDDYEVGYGKPPAHTRFKPGLSGNPKGRPKGTRNLKSDLAEELAERLVITEAGKRQTISKQRAMIKSLMAKAVSGDVRSANTLLDLCNRLLSEREHESEKQSLPDEDRAILDLYVNRVAKQDNKSDGET